MHNRAPAPGRRARLRGRASECALLNELVSAVRRGEGRSLVLRGEAGIGKTALLEYVVGSASDFTVLRAVGVESEMELAPRRLVDRSVMTLFPSGFAGPPVLG